MNKKEVIEFLAKSLEETSRLKRLHYNDEDFELWINRIKNVIKAELDQDDYKTFNSAYSIAIPNVATESNLLEFYRKNITRRETALKSIIQKYEILGSEEEPTEKKNQKDLAKPIQLFDAMQFHNKVVNASRALFEDKYYAQAIFEAFKVVENFVKEKSGSHLYGKQLMATAFSEDKPIIQVPEAGYFDKDVQEGLKFLFMGASQGIRNPKAHKEIIQDDPYITLEYLGFASFLLKRINYWGVGTK